MTTVRPYQTAAIEKFLAQKDKRLILAMATGAGKSRTALECAKAIGAKSVLVVASAQARPTWPREAERWAPELNFYRITTGPTVNAGSKAKNKYRDEAYAASYQVVSYALLKHLPVYERDLVVFDEVHCLKNPTSRQSVLAKAFMRQYPKMPALFLTATPIPREVMDVWNLVDTLFPGYLGKETDTGDISWHFKRTYCQSEMRSWDGGQATVYYGANPEALPKLAEKLEPVMHRVSSDEVAAYTPPFNASLLWIDEVKSTFDIASDWLQARAADESTHIGLFCWHHAEAEQLVAAARKAGWPVELITGLLTPEKRQEALDACKRAPRMCVIGTAGSLAESISLSFIKQALVFEWRAAPGQALQFSGRFARSDSESNAATYLLYVARTDDEAEALVLRERLDAVGQLYAQDSRSKALHELMAPRQLDEERLQTLATNMFSSVRKSVGFIDNDDEEEQDSLAG